jgi:hypothetical protein
MILASHGIVGSQIVQATTLLDLYPNAAAAYSLRLLRVGYTGSAIRVRRTDLAESDIGFTSTGALDTTALLAFTGTGVLDNGFVTTWYDQSGNSRDLTQATATNQPQIVSSGSIITENGLPTISFTSNDKKMQTINNSLFFNNCTISYVGKYITNNASYSGGFGYGNQGQGGQCRYLNTISNNLGYVNFGQDYRSAISASGDSNIALYSANYISTSNTVTVYKNNTSETGTPSTNGVLTTTSKFSMNEIADRGGMSTAVYSEAIFYAFNNNSNLSNIRSNQNSFYSIY